MAVRTKALDRMWTDWRATFPASNRAEDGWIGDAAHQAETSGHNPDDTPGSRAEYSDADTLAEVRAIDKDARLNSTTGMQQVVDRMLATPKDRDRLRYVIFNGHIWRKNGGWARETYTGSDQHRTHAHFSGDPNFDDAAAEWTSITSFKGGASAAAEESTVPTAAELAALTTSEALYKINLKAATYKAASTPFPVGTTLIDVPNNFLAIENKIDGLVTAVADLVSRPAGAVVLTEPDRQAIIDGLFDKLATKLGQTLIGALLDPQVRAVRVEDARQGAELSSNS